jgi:hypothetical protein
MGFKLRKMLQSVAKPEAIQAYNQAQASAGADATKQANTEAVVNALRKGSVFGGSGFKIGKAIAKRTTLFGN